MHAPTPATATAAGTPPVRELRRGGLPLLGAVALYGGSPVILLQTGGLFIEPVTEATGLPVSAVAIGPIIILVLALCQPLVGVLVGRMSPRPLAIVSLLTMIGGLIAVAVLPASGTTFLVISVLIGIGGSLGFTATIAKYLSMWFRKNFGLAFGIVGGAASLIPLIAIPIITAAIYSYGWRAGYWVLVGFVALVSLPIVLLTFRRPTVPLFPEVPPSVAVKPDVDASGLQIYRTVLADPRYWLMLVSVSMVTIAVGGFITHLQPMLLLNGVPVEVATGMSMAILLGVLSGRVIGGFLLDRVWPYWVPTVALTAAAIAAFALTTSASSLLLPYLLGVVFMLGLAQGAEADFPAFFLLREFGPRPFAVISSYAFLMTGICASVGGITFSALRDLTGSYTTAGILGASLFAVGMALMLVVGLLSKRAVRRGEPIFAGHSDA